MDSSLAGKLPGVATYAGYAIDGSPSRVRDTVTPRGLHATIRSAVGDFVVDPIPGNADGLHISYFENDIAPAPGDRFDFDDAEHQHSIPDGVGGPVSSAAEIPPAMQTENQTNIDTVIGDANYDIGHVFATSGGGRSSIGVVGRSGVKARAVSANNLNSSWLTVATMTF